MLVASQLPYWIEWPALWPPAARAQMWNELVASRLSVNLPFCITSSQSIIHLSCHTSRKPGRNWAWTYAFVSCTRIELFSDLRHTDDGPGTSHPIASVPLHVWCQYGSKHESKAKERWGLGRVVGEGYSPHWEPRIIETMVPERWIHYY